MLTIKETDLEVAAEIDSKYDIVRSIYYKEREEQYVHKHDEQTDLHTCGYCNKKYKRKVSFTRHLKGCHVKIILDRIDNV